LDDSDDSESDGEQDPESARNHSSEDDDLERTSLRPLISPALIPARGPPHPSPLSKLWTEDDEDKEGIEDDDDDDVDSASPLSTDTESDGSSPRRRSSASRYSSKKLTTKFKKARPTRSRSSTVASLAAPQSASNSPVHGKKLARQNSQSSIQTVIAAETSFTQFERDLKAEETIRDLSVRNSPGIEKNGFHARHKSQAVSEFAGHSEFEREGTSKRLESQISGTMQKELRQAEQKYREAGWSTMRSVLERFADEVRLNMLLVHGLTLHREMFKHVQCLLLLLLKNLLLASSA
jgi:hypothetical protein